MYLIEVFIDDLKFLSIVKILRGIDEYEDGYSVFMDFCCFISECVIGIEYNGVSID